MEFLALMLCYTGCEHRSIFNLDSAVRSTHLTQPIDPPGETGEDLITNKVATTSPVSPDKSIDYAMHALPAAESGFKSM
jgi:hypothetical protein